MLAFLARYRDVAVRAAWTFLYVFVAALLVQIATVDTVTDLTGSVIQAGVIAAALAAVKTLLAWKIGDPLAIKTNLSDLGQRLVHTAWQSLVAVLLAGGFSFDKASLFTVIGAVIFNAIKGVSLPSLDLYPAFSADDQDGLYFEYEDDVDPLLDDEAAAAEYEASLPVPEIDAAAVADAVVGEEFPPASEDGVQ